MILRYLGRTKSLGNLWFQLEGSQNGKQLTFADNKRIIYVDQLPAKVSIAGAAFEVLGYDKTTYAVRLRRTAAMPVGPMSIPLKPETVYIYVPG